MFRPFQTILCVFFVCALPVSLCAQDEEPVPTNQIKISALRFIDPFNMGLELSYEKLHTDRFSSQVFLAYLHDFMNLRDYYKGFRVGLEEKYYLKRESKVRSYFSAELVFAKVNYDYTSEFTKDTSRTAPRYFDTYRVMKNAVSLAVKAGICIPMRRFFLEFSGGTGIKYKMIRRTGIDDPAALMVIPHHDIGDFQARQAGNNFDLSIPMNVALGYRF